MSGNSQRGGPVVAGLLYAAHNRWNVRVKMRFSLYKAPLFNAMYRTYTGEFALRIMSDNE